MIEVNDLFIPCKKFVGYQAPLIPDYYKNWKGKMTPEMEKNLKEITDSNGEPMYEDVLIPLNIIFGESGL